MSIYNSGTGQTAQYKSSIVVFDKHGTIKIGNCLFQAKEDNNGIVLFDGNLSNILDRDNRQLRMSANQADFIEYLSMN